MYKRGEIYLARLNPRKGNEVGKLRPVLIFQTDMLNSIGHPTTTILPLSTKVIENTYPLRYKINSRDALEQTSDILCDQIRTIDNKRIIDKKLTTLLHKEMLEISAMVTVVLEIET